jgi:hypothetical protein
MDPSPDQYVHQPDHYVAGDHSVQPDGLGDRQVDRSLVA